MVTVNIQLLLLLEKIFDKLIDRLHGLEAFQGDRILYPRVMSIKGDDVLHPHIRQLLQCQRTVQRLPVGTAVLTAFIQKGHDHIDPAGLAGGSRDYPF